MSALERIRNDLADEVRKYEQFAKTNASAKMLLKRGICCFPCTLNEVRRCEQQLVPHHWFLAILKKLEECHTGGRFVKSRVPMLLAVGRLFRWT